MERGAAHPRSRGEHEMLRYLREGDVGSSPLARGTHRKHVRRTIPHRLIPARAGNTVVRLATAWRAAAHPRSRGEHEDRPGRHLALCGSSPLARGTLKELGYVTEDGRLIPARAGNTRTASTHATCPAAHPRSRGEHLNNADFNELKDGSSPLARGTREAASDDGGRGRLIPARAGNTRSAGAGLHLNAAHPRSRGEHARTSTTGASDCGSSPLARGTLNIKRK